MQAINTLDELREAIRKLELQHEEEGKQLRNHFQLTYESVKPINLIKSTFKDIADSKEMRSDLLNSSIGLATGYISKIIFQGLSHSPLRKLAGTAIMFGISSIVSKHPDKIKDLGKGLFNIIREKWAEKKP
ncbi:MAG: hypothetical protein WAR77_14055 [Saprospiraceae bacterium]